LSSSSISSSAEVEGIPGFSVTTAGAVPSWPAVTSHKI